MIGTQTVPEFLARQFAAGYVPMDEPPGMEEAAYKAWKDGGGQVDEGQRFKTAGIGMREFSALTRRSAITRAHYEHWLNGFFPSFEAMLLSLVYHLAKQHNDFVNEVTERSR